MSDKSTEATKEVTLINGASSGFGALTARALAQAGHFVYASMLNTTTHNAAEVAAVRKFADEHRVHLRAVELDVTSQAVASTSLFRMPVIWRLDRLRRFPPSSLRSFTTLTYWVRNASIAPHYRTCEVKGVGLSYGSEAAVLVEVHPPYLAPYFAAKAAMDSLAVSYAGELSRWGIETTIIVPGAFTSGTNHFANAGKPDDQERAALYEAGPCSGLAASIMDAQLAVVPADADVLDVAEAIVRAVDTPLGQRPFRIYIDPAQDGAEVVGAVADRVRSEFLRRIGLGDLLQTTVVNHNY